MVDEFAGIGYPREHSPTEFLEDSFSGLGLRKDHTNMGEQISEGLPAEVFLFALPDPGVRVLGIFGDGTYDLRLKNVAVSEIETTLVEHRKDAIGGIKVLCGDDDKVRVLVDEGNQPSALIA